MDTNDFQLLFEAAPHLYLVLLPGPDFTIVGASDAYLRATLTNREQVLGRGLFDVFPDNPDDPQATGVRNLRASLERVLRFKAADSMQVQKYDIRKPDSEGGGFEERHWSPVNYPVLRADREIAYIIHNVEDVTEIVRLRQQGIDQQKLLDELRSDERFRKAFNANPEPITIATVEGRYIDVNESFLRVTGYRRNEVIGHTVRDLNFWEHPDDRARIVETLGQQDSVRDLEISFRTKSGKKRTGSLSAEGIEIGGQKCLFSIFKDVTERKILEDQLRQAAKMEAIGQLSGGVAHDFNNLLSVIIGYCEILADQLPSDSLLLKQCRQIQKAGEKAAVLTRQLLAFSRQQVLEPKVMDLNAAVRDMEALLRRLIGEDIDFSTSLASSLGRVKADRGQIEQIIMNLVVNARDAMPQGGRLTIETSNVEFREDYVGQHSVHPAGRYVLLSVSDTGIGMTPETQARIFDPFFTTKGVGKGTGLGLSTVYGVVQQSDGHISVYSELGHGTTFKIWFPRIEQSSLPETSGRSIAQVPAASATVLLVEDEEALRPLIHRFLAEGGYTVLEAEHPEKALEIAANYRAPIHLLLTDVIMPGMNGRALVEKLMRVRPGLKAVFMSGYTGFAHGDLLKFGPNFLSKPFTRESLLRKLHDVLSFDPESCSTEKTA